MRRILFQVSDLKKIARGPRTAAGGAPDVEGKWTSLRRATWQMETCQIQLESHISSLDSVLTAFHTLKQVQVVLVSSLSLAMVSKLEGQLGRLSSPNSDIVKVLLRPVYHELKEITVSGKRPWWTLVIASLPWRSVSLQSVQLPLSRGL